MKKIFTILAMAFSIIVNAAQKEDNYIIDHSPNSMIIKVHLVNTSTFNWINDKIGTLGPVDINGGIVAVRWDGDIMGSYSVIENKSELDNSKTGIGDTVATLQHTFNIAVNHTVVLLCTGEYIEFPNGDSQSGFVIEYDLSFTDLLTKGYTPCYASVGPTSNVPTVTFESPTDNMISHYTIKRNGDSVATIPYSPGILSWTDSENTTSSNFSQTYVVEAVDSVGNSASGTVSTIHATNVSTVNGGLAIFWTTPLSAGTITEYSIYKVDNETLSLVATVPSTISQYTVTNPDLTKSYVVGTTNIDCIGTAINAKTLSSDKLLSNNVYAVGAIGIMELSGNSNDEIIGYFDLTGRPINKDSVNQIVIVQYKSGKTAKQYKSQF